MSGRFIGELRYPSVRSGIESDKPVILSLGALEQHGPHLPLSTDTVIAERLAEFLAEGLGALRLPTLAYGAPSRPRSGGGDRFLLPAVSLPTLFRVVEELSDVVFQMRAACLIVVSWHWENAAVIWDAVRAAQRRTPGMALVFDSPADLLPQALLSKLFPEGFPGWATDHAGRLETALMTFLAPDQMGSPNRFDGFEPLKYDVIPTPSEAVPDDGVYYDPGVPSAELGESCFKTIGAALLEICQQRLALPTDKVTERTRT